MNTRLYVGNLPYNASEPEIRTYFEANGGRRVTEVKIITDRDSGRPRGFAFVEMAEPKMADSAIAELHGQKFGGRTIVVNHAHARDGGGGGGGGGGGSRGSTDSRARARD